MTKQNNAKFAFYYLLSLVALVFVAISVGLIVFGIINKSIPDIGANYWNTNNQFKFAISALIIATPIYFILTRLIRQGLKKGEILPDSGIRRWLTYFIIFVASVIILGFLISVINSFLSGELTTRFILKALSVFIIAGLVFAYYLYDIKQDDLKKSSLMTRIFLFLSLAIILAAFISVWFFIESPKTARYRRLDQLTLNQISMLESNINSYYEENDKLPGSLIDVFADEDAFTSFSNEWNIEYRKLDEEKFELCASFNLDSSEINSDYYFSNNKQSYKAGYNCLPGNLWKSNLMEPKRAIDTF
jgi:hypothetical protein